MNYRYVSFPMEKLVLKDRCYELVGATALKRRQTEIKYLTYVNRNGEWLQYDNTKVKLVNRCVVQRICAVILLYQEI